MNYFNRLTLRQSGPGNFARKIPWGEEMRKPIRVILLPRLPFCGGDSVGSSAELIAGPDHRGGQPFRESPLAMVEGD